MLTSAQVPLRASDIDKMSEREKSLAAKDGTIANANSISLLPDSKIKHEKYFKLISYPLSLNNNNEDRCKLQ